MKHFFNRHSTRYTATVMVFVWLVSLGIGIANACSLGIPQVHDSYVMGPQVSAHANPSHDRVASDKAVCVTFCADEQSAIVKIKPLDGPSDWQMVPVLWHSVLPAPVPGISRPSTPQALSTGYELPVSIRFVRLTI